VAVALSLLPLLLLPLLQQCAPPSVEGECSIKIVKFDVLNFVVWPVSPTPLFLLLLLLLLLLLSFVPAYTYQNTPKMHVNVMHFGSLGP